MSSTGSSTNPIQYANGYQTPTGLYRYGQRYYDPQDARWTQPDPLDQPEDLRQGNAYGYAALDPVNFADPTGEIVPAVVAIGVFAVRVAAHSAGRQILRSRAGGVLLRPDVQRQLSQTVVQQSEMRLTIVTRGAGEVVRRIGNLLGF